MKKHIFKLLAACICIMTAVSSFSSCSFSEMTDPQDSQDSVVSDYNTAPDFTVKMNNGSKFTLSEARGKVVVINLWATWCGPCCRELPAFQRLYTNYPDELQIIAVNIGESKKTVDKFIRDNYYTFPFGYDTDGKVSELYPTNGIPYTIIIDKNGCISQTFTGARSADEQYEIYKKAIEDVLNEE